MGSAGELPRRSKTSSIKGCSLPFAVLDKRMQARSAPSCKTGKLLPYSSNLDVRETSSCPKAPLGMSSLKPCRHLEISIRDEKAASPGDDGSEATLIRWAMSPEWKIR